MTTKICLITLLAALLVANKAEAAGQYWSTPAAGCVPDSTSITNQRYVSNAVGAVLHRPGNLDLITLNCPITGFHGSGDGPNRMTMTYRDSTSTLDTAAFVRATLTRTPKATGASPTPIATLSSETPPAPQTITTASTPVFTHTFDFENNFYFVRVELDRRTTSQIVIVFGVYLYRYIP